MLVLDLSNSFRKLCKYNIKVIIRHALLGNKCADINRYVASTTSSSWKTIIIIIITLEIFHNYLRNIFKKTI